MRRLYVIPMTIVLLLTILISACNSRPSQESPAEFKKFDPVNFDNSTVIDNEWMPLRPGVKRVYEGTALEEGESISRRIEFTVTDLTKKIEEVRTVVGWIVDYTNGELVEKEIAFYAQDNEGNVWYLGEHPEDYENGEFAGSPTWIAGLEDAKAGIKMLSNPQMGDPIYYQGWGPAVGWSDYGQVDQMGQETCVPVKCYKDVLVMDESSLEETGAYQLKYYARGVGEVKVGWKGADETQEELELIELSDLSPEQMAEVRTEALGVEKHAYEVNDVYKQTSPAEYPPGTPAITIDIAEVPQANVLEDFAPEIVVYASELPDSALFELDFYDDKDSPGKKLISLPNNGDELDPPPEDDPHATFNVQVQSGIPYRCWIHMKVGTPKGRSQANTIWVQLSGAVDEANKAIFKPGSSSYLTAQGPAQEGWAWVGCDVADSPSVNSLIYFQTSGEITVRLQAGSEGVGFDQLVLSSNEYLDTPPADSIVEK